MNDDIQDIAKDIRATLGRAKDYSSIQDAHQLFIDVENIIAAQAYLIGPKSEAEQAYRALKVEYLNRGLSAAESDARAKASEEYLTWRKLEGLYLLAEQQIAACKKFKDDLTKEFKRS